MKKWNSPEINSIDISSTEHDWLGLYKDGGYIGDGEISGHLTWDKPSCPDNGPSNSTPSPAPDSIPSSDPTYRTS